MSTDESDVSIQPMPTRPVRRRPVDRTVLHLVRLVVADEWTACAAARSLRADAPAPTGLRRARARIDVVAADGPGHFTERAQLTMNAAMDHADLPRGGDCRSDDCLTCAAARRAITD